MNFTLPEHQLQRALKELQAEQQRTALLSQRLKQQEGELKRLRAAASRESNSRLMAEEALDETQDRLGLAVSAAKLALWEWNIHAGTVFLSERWGEMLGDRPLPATWTLDDLMSRVHPDDATRVREAVQHTLSGASERYVVEHRVQAAQGWIWIESHGIVTARDMLGEPTRLTGTHADVTVRKTTQEQMQRARELAESASRAKSEFLANMSHEVRTPLNGILGLTRLLADSEVTPEQAEYLALVDNSARNLLTLLNDVLDFSKIEAGKMAVAAIPFQLDRWLDETAAPYLVAAREKGLRMQVRTEGRLPPAVIGDPGRLRQVVTNLLSNAIKFTDRGEVELAVIERGAQGSQVRLRFEVSDTGVGISLDKQATVFGAFDQADTSVTRKYGGTGLGLAICERLVRLMGGGIKLVSVPDKGSVFAFELLLALADDETLPLLHRTQVPADAFKGLRVLLAEDNAVNELLMRKMLAQMGCEVAVAHNGREVIARWEQGGLDLILMDVQMPEVSGLEASQQIRERERGTNRRTPIVALTAHALVGDRERCLEAGMDGYVTKPVETQQLVEAMEAARKGTAVVTAQPQAVRQPPSGTPVQTSIDAQKLLQRMGGDKEALQDVAVAMRADLTQRMALLEEALTTRNAELARIETHALKGSLASITAERAAMLVKALEMAAQQKAWDLFQRAMPMLRLEARRIDSELADLLPPQ